MTELAATAVGRANLARVGRYAPQIAAAAGFAILFWRPLQMLAFDWWTDPEAGHGLLIAPLALWLAWRSGLSERSAPRPLLGVLLLGAAVGLRYLAGLAGEWFTMRLSVLMAAAALVLF